MYGHIFCGSEQPDLEFLLVSQECYMLIINILRDIWTRYGGGFNNLSRSE